MLSVTGIHLLSATIQLFPGNALPRLRMIPKVGPLRVGEGWWGGVGWGGEGGDDELGAVRLSGADPIRGSGSGLLSLVPLDHVCLIPGCQIQSSPPPLRRAW